MNNSMKQVFETMGLTVSKDNAYGAFGGYEVSVSSTVNTQIVWHVACYISDEVRPIIAQALNNVQVKSLSYTFSPYGMAFCYSALTYGTIAKNFEQVVTDINGILQGNGAKGVGYCPVCGEELNYEQASKRNIDGFTITLCNDCVQRINDEINEQNRQMDELPNNYGKGFAGALIGGAVGIALSVVLSLIGFISALSAFVAFIVGEKLYVKFGGKPNKVMIAIVAGTTLVCMLVGVVATYALEIAIAASEVEIEFAEALEIVIADEDFIVSFAIDLILTVVFTVVGTVYEIVKLSKEINSARSNI